MTDREELKAELVELFRRGATVAELLRVARDAAGEAAPHREWVGVVREAFGLGLAGWYLPAYTEGFGGDSPAAKLTWVFLKDFLETRPKWDTPGPETQWYDGLTKTPFDQWEPVAATSHGLSPEGWAALGEDDRRRVIGLEKMRLAWSEDIQILAALAERLQQRVNELERQRDNQPAAVGTA